MLHINREKCSVGNTVCKPPVVASVPTATATTTATAAAPRLHHKPAAWFSIFKH